MLAINLGQDSDTVAAVTGQLAGAIYGRANIPQRWMQKLAWATEIERRTGLLIKAGNDARNKGKK